MRSPLTLLAVTLAICLVSACGSSNAQKNSPQPTPTPQPVTASPTSSVASGSNSVPAADIPVAGAVNSGATSIARSNGNTRVANVLSTPAPPQNSVNRPVDGLAERRNIRSRGDRVPVPEGPKPPPIAFQKAPENSEFASYMVDGGQVVEVRVFKNHPQIRKVEMVWTGPNDRVLRMFLKSGKTVGRSAPESVNLRNVPSAELLKIAGVSKN